MLSYAYLKRQQIYSISRKATQNDTVRIYKILSNALEVEPWDKIFYSSISQ